MGGKGNNMKIEGFYFNGMYHAFSGKAAVEGYINEYKCTILVDNPYLAGKVRKEIEEAISLNIINSFSDFIEYFGLAYKYGRRSGKEKGWYVKSSHC